MFETKKMNNVEAPDGLVDKNGFSIKPPISDKECILICLKNALSGTKKQVARLIDEIQNKNLCSFESSS